MSIEEDVRRLQVDMWEGQGLNNPSVVVRLATIEGDMDLVKEGVSNFREHSKRATTFFDSAEAVWKADRERRARNWKIVMFLALFLVPGVTWAGGKLITALYQVLEIEQQWQQAHPSEFVKPQQMFDQQSKEQATKDFAY